LPIPTGAYVPTENVGTYAPSGFPTPCAPAYNETLWNVDFRSFRCATASQTQERT
jgi:hypothetical protein